MAASEELLGRLHEAVAQLLLDEVQGEEPSPQIIAQAIKMLKDNSIEAVPTEDNALGKLAKELPKFNFEEPLHGKH